jgi:N utilization substance protein A
MDMNTKELMMNIEAVAKEKGISREVVFNALADGMATALRHDYPDGSIIKVLVNYETGEFVGYRLFELVDQIENVEAQMLYSEVENEMVRSGFVYEPIFFELNRQQFNITKQVALNIIRNFTRSEQINGLLDKSIKLQQGTVKVVKKEQLIVDCNGLDISIPRKNLLPRDNYKYNDKIFFVLEKEKNNFVGSRISNNFLIEIFKKEIYQVEDGDIEIVAISRIPGFRAKVALRSKDPSVNPLKFCVGSKGVHIKNINNFLNGEVVDLVLYEESTAKFLVNAINPISVCSILIDEDKNTVFFSVKDDEISQAVGKNGKNIELISNLLGVKLEVFSQSEWEKRQTLDKNKIIYTFQKALECDTEIAETLYQNGFTSLEEIAYVPSNEFDIPDFDDELIEGIKSNAAIVLSNEISTKMAVGYGELYYLGFDLDDIETLQKYQVYDKQDVSDLSAYELKDILPNLTEEYCQKIILLSRQ